MTIHKRLLEGVSHDILRKATERKFFAGTPLFLIRMKELDEYINGTLHCTYKLQNECGEIVAYYGNTAALAFQTAQDDGYDVRFAH